MRALHGIPQVRFAQQHGRLLPHVLWTGTSHPRGPLRVATQLAAARKHLETNRKDKDSTSRLAAATSHPPARLCCSARPPHALRTGTSHPSGPLRVFTSLAAARKHLETNRKDKDSRSSPAVLPLARTGRLPQTVVNPQNTVFCLRGPPARSQLVAFTKHGEQLASLLSRPFAAWTAPTPTSLPSTAPACPCHVTTLPQPHGQAHFP